MPQLVEELRRQGAGWTSWWCAAASSPPQDYDYLYKAGAAAIYGPGTNIPKAAADILGILRKRRAAA